MWNVTAKVIPVIMGATGTISLDYYYYFIFTLIGYPVLMPGFNCGPRTYHLTKSRIIQFKLNYTSVCLSCLRGVVFPQS